MSGEFFGATEQEARQLLALKDEIVQRWEQLPPEHQATMLLVLLDRSPWAAWSVNAWLTLRQGGDDGHECESDRCRSGCPDCGRRLPRAL